MAASTSSQLTLEGVASIRLKMHYKTVGYEVPIMIRVKTKVTIGSAIKAVGQNQMITAAIITPIEFKRSPRT